MKLKKIEKGQFGYIAFNRKTELIKTIILFALSAAIYGIGYYSTGSNKNLLTIVAILGCLPASKFLVETIMYFRAQGCSAAAEQKIALHTDGLKNSFDLYMTGYKKNFPLSHVALKGNTVIGFTESNKFDESAFAEHIKTILLQNGFKSVTFKVFTDLDKYTNRLDQISSLETDSSIIETDLLQLLHDISL